MYRLHGYDAIRHAEARGLTLCKYTDPTEEARTGLSIIEAEGVASEDPGLIYLDDPSDPRIILNRSPHCPDGWWIEYTDVNGDAANLGPFYRRDDAEAALERGDHFA